MNDKKFKLNQDEIDNLINWSEEYLRQAEANFKMGFVRGAVSRAYYSAFDLVRALFFQIISK